MIESKKCATGWLVLNARRSANLSEVHLLHARLHWTDVRGVPLCRTNLEGVDLNKADLRGANLQGAFLDTAIKAEANVSRGDLRRKDLNKRLAAKDCRPESVAVPDDHLPGSTGGSPARFSLPIHEPRRSVLMGAQEVRK